MKKIITGTILTVMMLALGTAGTIYAASDNNYTDKDNNGICDNIDICSDNETGKKNCQNGNGGNGTGYTDEDNDGICDNTGAKNCNNSGKCRRAEK